jgi:hypothetical protein
MPRYHFITRGEKLEGEEPVAGDFRDDNAAIEDARAALADMMRDAAIEGTKFDDEIEVRTEFGKVIAKVNLKEGG